MDAIVLNCVTQFNIVWRVGNFLFLPMSKCRKPRCITVAETLFLRNVSTANTRCSSDGRCMTTEGFKPLYPAICVSPRHLQRWRHGAKFKSSNRFCPTLYQLRHDCLSVRMELLGSHWTEFHEILYLENLSRQFQLHYSFDA